MYDYCQTILLLLCSSNMGVSSAKMVIVQEHVAADNSKIHYV
jgi:hypothetical protein